jgi:lipopolysaccharide export system permease protein
MRVGTKIYLYLTKRFFVSTLIVFFTCLGLILLVDFAELLRRTADTASVGVADVLHLALLRLPTFTEQLFPFAVLFGTMGALLRLSQRSELVIMRSAGLSVWQFLMPGLGVALSLGLFGTLVYNPLAANTRERADRIEATMFGKKNIAGGTLQTTSAGAWIRQEGQDGQFILNATTALQGGTELMGIEIHIFDRDGNFVSRLDARKALLRDGFWELNDALLTTKDATPEHFSVYQLPTNLTPTQVRESFASIETISFYELPGFIRLSEKAGLAATRIRLQYQTLIARPWLLVGMVLIAATVSLRLFRFGHVLPLILGGIGAGFLLYLTLEIAKQLGRSGLIGVVPAAWVPVVVAMLTGLTILLHQEDG